MLQGQGLVVVPGDARAIVLDLDGIQALVLETDLCKTPRRSVKKKKQKKKEAENKLRIREMSDIPILVAPASRLFSTSSFTTEQRSTMTWPD